MTCGLATLDLLSKRGVYRQLDALTRRLCEGLETLLREKEVPARINRVGSMFTLFFTEEEVFDYASAKKSDTRKYAEYFRRMLEQGIWLPPSQFEACFVSLAHTERDIMNTLKAAASALDGLR
jgi:glutamate-1-semialdehyde 2,1-aminomutase